MTLIKVENVSKSYGSFKALNKISFEIKKGEVVGFLGPNGAGKTTTIKLLTCNSYPHEGSIKIAGYDVLEDSLKVRRHIGYLPESAPLYKDMLVREYLEYAASSRGIPSEKRSEKVQKAAESCGLTAHLNRKITQLSKGYRQRVGLAQAIIHEPDVLILDEPYTGLDPIQIIEIRNLIKSYGENHTVLLSSHILQEVEATCSRVLIINEGNIVADGQVKELLGHDILKAKIEGEDPSIKQTFKSLDSVEFTGSSTWSEDGRSGLEVRLKAKGNINETAELIFETCKKENWKILSLEKGNLTFEDLFIKYTRSESKTSNSDNTKNKNAKEEVKKEQKSTGDKKKNVKKEEKKEKPDDKNRENIENNQEQSEE